MYPISVNLRGKTCLVVGGGKVAERRIASMREQGADITLAAPSATPALQDMAASGALRWRRENYRSEMLDGMFLVIAATDQREINAAVAREAQARNILVCCADGYEDGNFTTPAVVQRGDLVLTVTTGGQSPTLVALLRERLTAEYGPEWEALTTLLGRLRSDVQQMGDGVARRDAVQRIVDDEMVRAYLRQGDAAGAEVHTRVLLKSQSLAPEGLSDLK